MNLAHSVAHGRKYEDMFDVSCVMEGMRKCTYAMVGAIEMLSTLTLSRCDGCPE